MHLCYFDIGSVLVRKFDVWVTRYAIKHAEYVFNIFVHLHMNGSGYSFKIRAVTDGIIAVFHDRICDTIRI